MIHFPKRIFILLTFFFFQEFLIHSFSMDFDRPLVSLYQHYGLRGKRYEQAIGKRCYNLPQVSDNWASSLHIDGPPNIRCVTVCARQDCRGRCIEMYDGSKGHFDLREVDMNDVISSIKPCKSRIPQYFKLFK